MSFSRSRRGNSPWYDEKAGAVQALFALAYDMADLKTNMPGGTLNPDDIHASLEELVAQPRRDALRQGVPDIESFLQVIRTVRSAINHDCLVHRSLSDDFYYQMEQQIPVAGKVPDSTRRTSRKQRRKARRRLVVSGVAWILFCAIVVLLALKVATNVVGGLTALIVVLGSVGALMVAWGERQ